MQIDLLGREPFSVEGYFVGLDLSLRGAGVCMIDGFGTVRESGVAGYELKRTAPVREKIERMIEIAGFILDVCKKVVGNEYVNIGIENYAFSRAGMQNDLGELHGVVKSQIWLALSVEPDIVVVSSARKVVFGKGNFPKKGIMPALMERGIEFKNQDIADAYVVAEYLRIKKRMELENG